MPNPSWTPVIGSGFDQDAAQQQHWAGFNAQMDQANIARANAAQQNQNQWLQTAAAMRQQAIDRQGAADDAAQQQAVQQQTEAARAAESKRQFDVSADISRAGIAERDKQFTFTRDEQNRLERKQLDETESLAKQLAPEGLQLGEDHDAAQQAAAEADANLAAAVARNQPKLPSGSFKWVNGVNEWQNNDRNPATKDKTQEVVDASNEALAGIRAAHAKAKSDLTAAQQALAAFQNRIPKELHFNQNDYSIYSIPHKTRYGGQTSSDNEGDGGVTSKSKVKAPPGDVTGGAGEAASMANGFSFTPPASPELPATSLPWWRQAPRAALALGTGGASEATRNFFSTPDATPPLAPIGPTAALAPPAALPAPQPPAALPGPSGAPASGPVAPFDGFKPSGAAPMPVTDPTSAVIARANRMASGTSGPTATATVWTRDPTGKLVPSGSPVQQPVIPPTPAPSPPPVVPPPAATHPFIPPGTVDTFRGFQPSPLAGGGDTPTPQEFSDALSRLYGLAMQGNGQAKALAAQAQKVGAPKPSDWPVDPPVMLWRAIKKTILEGMQQRKESIGRGGF